MKRSVVHLISFRVQAEQGIVVTSWSGEITDEGLLDAYRSLFEDSDWTPKLWELLDVRAARLDGVTGEGLQDLAELVHENLGHRVEEFRTAVVHSRPLSFGITRMYQVFSEESPETVKIFQDTREALEWLGADGDLLD
jgi:hypothetical protein